VSPVSHSHVRQPGGVPVLPNVVRVPMRTRRGVRHARARVEILLALRHTPAGLVSYHRRLAWLLIGASA
jgi:hypothetical protein